MRIEHRGFLLFMADKKTLEQFIEESRTKWGNRVDFSKAVYLGVYKPITLICKEHGEFTTYPRAHLKNFSCPECTKNLKSKLRRKLICGVAVNDGEVYEVKTRIYNIWHCMIQRSCDSKTKQRNPQYKDTKICKEWLIYSNFKKWVLSEDSGYQEGFEIDKDIIGGSTNLYSPETCCFVHPRINKLLVGCRRKDNGLPIGVSKHPNGYCAYCSHGDKIINLGLFSNPENAFLAYKRDKEKYLKEIAEEYYSKGLMHKRVYDALMNYEVKYND